MWLSRSHIKRQQQNPSSHHKNKTKSYHLLVPAPPKLPGTTITMTTTTTASAATTTTSMILSFLSWLQSSDYYYPWIYTSFFGIIGLWMISEFCFLILFYKYLLPQANKIRNPKPFRDFNRNRQQLLLRVLNRIERICAATPTKKDPIIGIYELLEDWFVFTENPLWCSGENNNKDDVSTTTTTTTPPLSRAITPDSESSSDEEDDEEEEETIIDEVDDSSRTTNREFKSKYLHKEDMEIFFSWAFFGKHMTQLLEWEIHELQCLFDILTQRYGLTFPPLPSPSSVKKQQEQEQPRYHCQPRCMSLEPVQSIYRPLLVYIIVWCIHSFGMLVLYAFGYQRYVTSTGLVAWYRPPTSKSSSSSSSSSSSLSSTNTESSSSPITSSSLLPLLFFHGIAPAGLMLYLPMILFGLATERDRPIFLFENSSISCSIDWTFTPLTEEETVHGIYETLQHFHYEKSQLSLVGHSFGSCPITWLLASQKGQQLKASQSKEEQLGVSQSEEGEEQSSLLLRTGSLDIRQVTLLDPVTFLLSDADTMNNFLYAQHFDKIRMVASSELFTEFYLRRTLAWYNTELWMDHQISNPNTCHIFIGIAEQDEIINATKIRQEVLQHTQTYPSSQRELVYWKGASHGDCVISPTRWKEIKQIMLKQELHIVQQQQ